MEDLTGLKFNLLTVLKFDKKKNGRMYWLCKCECGQEKSYRSDLFKVGRRKSCGCIKSPNEQKYKERLKLRLKNNSASINGCQIWKGQSNPGGQGLIKIRTGMRNVGRAAWYAWNGNIPNGLFVLHSCDNPKCSEISHLRLGTHADNMKDKVERHRQHFNKGEIHGMSRFTDEQVNEIRYLYKFCNFSQAELSKKFNVCITTTHNIIKRKTWKHLPDPEIKNEK